MPQSALTPAEICSSFCFSRSMGLGAGVVWAEEGRTNNNSTRTVRKDFRRIDGHRRERWILLRQEFYYWLSPTLAASFTQNGEQPFFSNLDNCKLHSSPARCSDQLLFQITQATFFSLA